MSYKNLPARYKIGIIFVGIFLLISILSLVEYQNSQLKAYKNDMGTAGYWTIMLFGIALTPFYEKLYFAVTNLIYNADYAPNHSELFPLIVFILLNAILYFIMGYFIGLLIEKRKKSESYQQEVRPRASVLVFVVAWLMLVYGIVKSFLNLENLTPFIPFFHIKNNIALIQSIGLIAVFFGMRVMRRWALYTFTALTILAVGVSFYSFKINPAKDLTDFVEVGIQVLILVYLWAISKKFS